LMPSMISDNGDLKQAGNSKLVNETGGFERPAGKGPRALESPAITRAVWRFDTLIQRCRLVSLLSARDWEEEGPPPGLGAAGGAR
jgi:hypothetical protein